MGLNNSSIDKQDSCRYDPNKVEITKLETINEGTSIDKNEELNQIQSSSISSIQKTSSNNDNCEIVEIKSVIDYVDGQSQRKHREFTRPYRPIITVDENNVDQELNATINLNANDILNDKGRWSKSFD